MPAGRPTKMTDSVIKTLRDAYLIGCTDEEACLKAAINPATLYRYFEKNPEFKEKSRLLQENPCIVARQTVFDSLSDNPDIAFKYLERKRRDEFGPKQEHDHNINGSLALEVNFVSPETDENQS